jgi:hypothetical protein
MAGSPSVFLRGAKERKAQRTAAAPTALREKIFCRVRGASVKTTWEGWW